MSPIDWIIIVVTLLMAVWGYAQGLIVGALALVGFGLGGFLGSRLGPIVLEEGARSPFAPLFALAGALLVGGLLAAVLEVLGFRLRGRLPSGLGPLDGLGGAALVACIALGIAWIAAAVALQTPGFTQLRRDIQRSEILTALNTALPPSGPLLNVLSRFDPFPEIRGPSPDVRAPSSAIAKDPEVRGARRSVVRVLGTACGLGVSGSGWVAADGVVVTNAHVVAGQEDTTVQLGGEGTRHDADAIWFDPDNDLAILRVTGISGTPPLDQDSGASSGTSAAIMGYPQNGPFNVRAGRLGQTQTVASQDAYGRGPVRRRITALRGVVRQGNSGGPMVDGEGRVVTTIFASSLGSRQRTGYGVPASIVERALARADERVSTGPCSTG